MRRGCAALVLWTSAAAAQPVAPSDEVARAVFTAQTEFASLLETDPAAAHDRFSPDLAARMPVGRWTEIRGDLDGRTGPRRTVRIHALTFFPDDVLFAVLDYAQPFDDARGAICGTVVWRIDSVEALSVARITENVVELDAVRALPPGEARQLLTDWRCPADMANAIFGVSNGG